MRRELSWLEDIAERHYRTEPYGKALAAIHDEFDRRCLPVSASVREMAWVELGRIFHELRERSQGDASCVR